MKLNEKIMSTMRAATRTLASKGPIGATSVIQEALKILTPGNGPATNPASASAGPSASAPPGATHDAAPQMRDINPPPASSRPAGTVPPRAQAQAEQAPPKPEPQPQPQPQPAARTPLEEAQMAFQNLVPDMLSKLDRQSGVAGGGFKMPSFDMPKFEGGKLDMSKFDMPNIDLSQFDNLPGMSGAPGKAEPLPGQFIDGTYTNDAGTRTYKLYVPSTYKQEAGVAVPLVVMLHGCTQDPDDFATGTKMNLLAEEMQCLVVYPAQSQQANASRCWNWFSAVDQKRDQGEPSIIAGITRAVIKSHSVDEAQVYVAGLSAGGAMATIMGTLYSDLYAAVGVHSGLPFASAHDLPSALAAMKGNFGKAEPSGKAIPIIVFHGDRDTTVHPANGDELIKRGAHAASKEITIEPGKVENGHAFTRTVHQRADGTPQAEHWTIHGAGHAWSGGSSNGSYTDGKGPDASREMMRFFTTKR